MQLSDFITFTLTHLFGMHDAIIIVPTPYSQIVNVNTDIGLPADIFNMLDKFSQDKYIGAFKQINKNLKDQEEDYDNVINYMFKVWEHEFTSSIVQWMRWCLKTPMPQYFNKLWPKKDVHYHSRDINHRVNYNKPSDHGDKSQLQPPTIGDAINSIEVYCEVKHINLFPNGNESFINDCRNISNLFNEYRHSQHGIITYQEISDLKKQLDALLISYLPFFNALKLTLSGAFGPNIGKPPYITLNNSNLSFPDHPSETILETVPFFQI